MALNFRREIVTADLLAEAGALMDYHMGEVGAMPGLGVTMDVDAYVECEKNGLLRCYTARVDSGRLVGYCTMFVRSHPHQSGTVQAVQDGLFLDPESRIGLDGVRLIDFVDSELATEGVTAVFRQSPESRPIDPILSRKGYKKVETLFMRRLN